MIFGKISIASFHIMRCLLIKMVMGKNFHA
jgi:hypothetical protein